MWLYIQMCSYNTIYSDSLAYAETDKRTKDHLMTAKEQAEAMMLNYDLSITN